jgi:capsular exopolysaccharide synthesis family protein
MRGIASVAGDPHVVNAAKRVSDQEQILAGLAQIYRPEHPRYKEAQAQWNRLQANLNAAIDDARARVKTAYEAALGNEKAIRQALKAQEQLALQLDKLAIPYDLLNRSVEADQALYQALLTRLKETDIAKALDNTPIRVISRPRAAAESSGPKVLVIYGTAVFLGIFGGVGLCLFFSSLDASMHSVEDAENALNLPVLAAVPRGKGHTGIPMIAQPNSALAESFRSLRTVLELKEVTDRQVILITSSCAGEGKTFLSINTAIALAQQGYRTLLIDADLRNPCVGKRLNFSSKRAGLSDVLAGKMKLGDIDLTSDFDNLHILTAGTALSNPAELTAGNRVAELLKDPLFASFDRIIFDTAPVNPVSDALHLVRFATAVCLVVQAGRTSVNATFRALLALKGAHARDLGVILNGVSSVRYNPYGYKFSKTPPAKLSLLNLNKF